MSLTATEGKLLEVPLDLVIESPTNPRVFYDPDKLASLAESIRQHGLLQRVIVRETRDRARGWYEIIAGSRRFRACKLLDLEYLPVEVIEASDAQVRVMQAIENDEREGVTPIERARGYQSMIDSGLYGTGQDARRAVARQLGTSESTVYQRLQLLKGIPEAQEECARGVLSENHLKELARLPERAQEDAIGYLLYAPDFKDGKLVRGKRRDEEVLSVRSLKAWLKSKYKDLTTAPFPTNKLDLLPQAGSCIDCPKRTGFERDLSGSEHDLCLNSGCWADKVAAQDALVAEASREVADMRGGALVELTAQTSIEGMPPAVEPAGLTIADVADDGARVDRSDTTDRTYTPPTALAVEAGEDVRPRWRIACDACIDVMEVEIQPLRGEDRVTAFNTLHEYLHASRVPTVTLEEDVPVVPDDGLTNVTAEVEALTVKGEDGHTDVSRASWESGRFVKCKSCEAQVQFRTNVDTGKQVPLVPFDASFEKAVRFWPTGDGGCHRGDDGPLMSHFADCPGAAAHSKTREKMVFSVRPYQIIKTADPDNPQGPYIVLGVKGPSLFTPKGKKPIQCFTLTLCRRLESGKLSTPFEKTGLHADEKAIYWDTSGSERVEVVGVEQAEDVVAVAEGLGK